MTSPPLIKKKFDIPRMFEAIRHAIKEYPPAMLFQLRQEGHDTPFEQLIACLLSIRTRDEVSLKVARDLLALTRTPETLLKIPSDQLHKIVEPCTFNFQKVETLRKICRQILDHHQGKTPCDFNSLTAFPGVGPKCANLVLGLACHEPRIGVDIHVHRVTNRWGYVQGKTPEKTLTELEKVLPKSRWVEINELLVPFGKHICLGTLPRCTRCPVLEYCRQVGVRRFQ